ncbi:MAG TPA: ABC transporter substrate-binding protein [Anaeromyxobacter sp.]|nr:ABC transporter substrate-binding protein [Anaeromyxobacter sp.]
MGARAAAVLALALACTGSPAPPPPPEVRLLVSADLPGAAARELAARAGIARVTLVADPGAAEVVWVSDPVAALVLGERLAAGAIPEPAGVTPRWLDRRGRFAPLGARAATLLVSERAEAALPFAVDSLRYLVDPRLHGRVALVHPGRGSGPALYAALALAYGEPAALRYLRGLAASGPRVLGSEGEVRAAVASGGASVGLVGSLVAAPAAAGFGGLRLRYPDQTGAGTPTLPTAVAVLQGGGDGARRLAAWLVGPEAERLLVARAPGLLPLRTDVPVPAGVELAENLTAPALDWDRLAAEAAALAPVLARWPEAPAAPGAR